MTDEKTFADGVRKRADDDSPHLHQEPDRRGWTAAIKHRWPTWLAIVVAALTAGGDSDSLKGLSEALLLFALGYLGAAVLQRRQATWFVAVVGIGAVAALRLQGWVEPSVFLVVVALAFVLWGAARGQMWPPGALMLETAGMVIFATIALAALSVDQDLGRYLVAAGWLGHAAWDFAHLRADKVVSRSFAEWCAVVDFLGGVGILVVPML
jgi:hypothetical protein